MKKKIAISISVLFIILFMIMSNSIPIKSQSEPKYVGVTTCVGACHKTEAQGSQLSIWQNSKHSQAFKDLQTPVADSIATSKGFKTAAAETPECLKCHVLGKDMSPSEFEDTFDKTQGVQCETCHGPGSEYKKLSVMKDKSKAMEMGLVVHTEKEAFCTHCHNSESPTFKGFSYDSYWEKIKHSKPKE